MARFLASILVALLAVSSAASETLVVFTMASCGPCKRFKADYAADPSIAGGRKVVIHDVHQDRDEAAAFKARSYPTFVLVDGGVKPADEVRRRIGYDGPAGLRRWLSGGR